MQTAKVFINWKIDKENVIHLHNGFVFSHVKSSYFDNLDGDGHGGSYIMINNPGTERHIGYNLKQFTNCF